MFTRGRAWGGWVKQVKEIKSTLTMVSTESCMEPLNHGIV